MRNTWRRIILDGIQQGFPTTVDLPYCGQGSHTQELQCGENALPTDVW